MINNWFKKQIGFSAQEIQELNKEGFEIHPQSLYAYLPQMYDYNAECYKRITKFEEFYVATFFYERSQILSFGGVESYSGSKEEVYKDLSPAIRFLKCVQN